MRSKLLTKLLVFFIAISVGNKSYSRSSASKISNISFGNIIPNSPTTFMIDMNGVSGSPTVISGDVFMGGNPISGGVRINTNRGGIEYKYPSNIVLKNKGSTIDMELSIIELGDPDSSLSVFIGGRIISSSPGIATGTYTKTIKVRYRDETENKWRKQKVKIKVVVKEISIGIEVKDADINIGTILLEDNNSVVVGINLDGTSTIISGNAI